MRLSLVHLLVALLIAIFAIGVPSLAQAECAMCMDCGTLSPDKNKAPCPEKGIACQVSTNCASQPQKMPVPAILADDVSAGKTAFPNFDDVAVNLAFVKPETSPPRG